MIEIKFKCDKCNYNKGTVGLDDYYEPRIECSKCGNNESLYIVKIGLKEDNMEFKPLKLEPGTILNIPSGYVYKIDDITTMSRRLIISDFIGGILEIPLSKDTPLETTNNFMMELFSIPGVKEVFEKYGAIYKVDIK